MFENLPNTTFNTLVVDPPWPQSLTGHYKRRRHSRATSLPYRTLELDDIASFPLADLAGPGAHVYLWTTNKFLHAGFEILEKWKCSFHLCMPMVKPSGIAPCCGYVFASEFCLLGFHGRPMQPFIGMGKLNWLRSACVAGRHSVKPDEFYKLVEAMSPGPRIDCFARRPRPNWTTWGDEINAKDVDTLSCTQIVA